MLTGGNGSGVYTVTVGGGGGMSRGIGPSPNRRDGQDGNDSYFGPPVTPNGITNGGGGGGAESSPHPLNSVVTQVDLVEAVVDIMDQD